MRSIRSACSVSCLALFALGGCLDDANQQTVRADNLGCNVSGGPSRVLERVVVECVVKVGGTLVSKDGIQTSVQGILTGIVLPEVCPSYTRAELVTRADEFSDDVQSELAAAYVQANADWDIESADCSVSE